MRQKRSGQVAFGGMMAALTLAVMLLGEAVPLATFCAPAIGGILIMLTAEECGPRAAWGSYAAVALLSLWLLPDVEMSMIFALFLGWYPLAKPRLDRLRHHVLRLAAKLALFNAAVQLMYLVLLVLFPVGYLTAEMGGYGRGMIAALLVLANLAFCLYDLALCRVRWLYLARLRPRLTGSPARRPGRRP